jgi:hypothetical protein
MAEKSVTREVRIAGQRFTLQSRDVRLALRHVEPEPIASHFVVVGKRRFPPKQAISAVTGLDRADFTTHQARRTLMRLGFPAGRRRAASLRRTPSATLEPTGRDPASSGTGERLADRLRPLTGQWVAIKDDDILFDAPTPQQLVGWLSEHGQKADSVFRVPEDELAATGLAPQ